MLERGLRGARLKAGPDSTTEVDRQEKIHQLHRF